MSGDHRVAGESEVSDLVSVAALAERLGVAAPSTRPVGVDWALPIVSALGERGATVLVKSDGERHSSPFTAVVSGLRGGGFVRRDGTDVARCLMAAFAALADLAPDIRAENDFRAPVPDFVCSIGDWELLIREIPGYALITDFELTSPSGDRYFGSAGTPEMVRDLMGKVDCLNPFWMSDLILIDTMDRSALVNAVTELIERDEVASALEVAEPSRNATEGDAGDD